MRTTMIASVLAALLLGCRDDGGGGVSTGLPASKRLSDLEPDEVVSACEEFVASLDSAVADQVDEFDCTLRALPMSVSVTLSGQLMGDVTTCRDLVNRCLRGEDIGGAAMPAPVMNISDQIDCNAPEAQASVAGCDATVRQFEGCANGLVAELDRVLSSVSCSDLEDLETLQGMPGPPAPMFEQPAQCADLEARCPNIGITMIGQ